MKHRLPGWMGARGLARLLALACLGWTDAAWSQAVNTARIAAPPGITETNLANNESTVTTPLVANITTSKQSDVGTGIAVHTGDVLTYTVTAVVSGDALVNTFTLTDTLSAGLAFGAISSPGAYSCSGTGPVVCTLPAGTLPGTYAVSYTAIVQQSATTAVSNTVTPSEGTCTTCTTTNPLIAVATSKMSDVGSGTPVLRGDTIAYTVTSQITGDGTLAAPLVLTDTLSAGLAFASLTSPGAFACSGTNPLTCTLPAGTGAGSYAFTYTAVVQQSATTAVSNTVTPSEGTCTTCTTTNPLLDIATVKSSDVGNGTQVATGATLLYTLTTTIAGGALTEPFTLTDTLGAGLAFGAVTSAGSFTCNATNPVVCTLPAGTAAGTYAVSYSATVEASATVAVNNRVVPSDGTCVTCTTTNPLLDVVVGKTSDVGDGVAVQVGDTLTYTVTTIISGGSTLASDLVLTDTLGPGLAFGAITSAGGYSCVAGNPVVCTLPTGTGTGSYPVSYTATVEATAVTSVNNVVVPNQGTCTDCETENPLVAIATSKSSDVGNGTAVQRGQILTYTLTSVVTGAGTLTRDLVLTDTLGAGLAFTAITAPGAFQCGTGNPVICRLPAGTTAGTYAVSYSVTVAQDATVSVSNTVVPNDGTCTTCTTTNPVVDIATIKSSNVGAATPVRRGDTLTYTLASTISGGALSRPLTLTDTLGPGLAFGAVSAAGAFTCNAASPLICSLPAGTPAGSYPVSYTVTVTSDATATVNNSVVPSEGTCTTCRIDNPLVDPVVSYAKAATLPAGQTVVRVGDAITYTLSTTVANAPAGDVITLTDTLGSGLAFASVTSAGSYTCNAANPLVCTLPAGTAVGTYALSYTATVTPQAVGLVRNAVVASGGDQPGCTGPCETDTPVASPVVQVAKSSDPASGNQVEHGQTIAYLLTVTVANAPTTSPLVLTDTIDPGLTLASVPAECSGTGTPLTCTLPTGTPVGVHVIRYSATVNEQASGSVRNLVVANGGGPQPPECGNCNTEHPVDTPQIRILKTAGAREVRIGDLVRYTLHVENIGNGDLIDGYIVDRTPAGFSYVAGSLQAGSRQGISVSGNGPLRFGGINLAAGESFSLVYLMRVGAGVRPGTHVNQAQVFAPTDDPISNIATAQVVLAIDPLTDESLILGTVFDDRDGDGWQDSAALSRVQVQGGFAASAYVPASTSIDRGAGPVPQADASAPLLHGLALGAISGRQSDGDVADNHRLVIRQRLREPAFTDDFVLTSAEGVTVRMDAQGRTRIEKQGDAARGLSAAEPTVDRILVQDADGLAVDYVIRNTGVDERGIPGVRIASVEGLLMETDQFGRYHLAGIAGGAWERGRNFVLKVDPATLPIGSEFTTDNPLLRRITPGVPVRFDWGVKLPPGQLPAARESVEMVLGKVLFAPGSAQVRPAYLPAIEQMAARIREHGGGDIIIDASGDSEALAFERAAAVKAALLQRLDAPLAGATTVAARARVDDPSSLIAGIGEGGVLLGTLLFDNDRASIRPRYAALLDQIATALEQSGGGRIAVVGHTDVHGSHAYNTALGMRRARAVYEAIVARLSPELRAKVRVEASEDTRAPVDARQGGTP